MLIFSESYHTNVVCLTDQWKNLREKLFSFQYKICFLSQIIEYKLEHGSASYSGLWGGLSRSSWEAPVDDDLDGFRLKEGCVKRYSSTGGLILWTIGPFSLLFSQHYLHSLSSHWHQDGWVENMTLTIFPLWYCRHIVCLHMSWPQMFLNFRRR